MPNPNPKMTDRESAIEGVMAVAALAAGNPMTVATGQAETVISAALKSLSILGVTAEELATVTLKTTMVNPDADPEGRDILRRYAKMGL